MILFQELLGKVALQLELDMDIQIPYYRYKERLTRAGEFIISKVREGSWVERKEQRIVNGQWVTTVHIAGEGIEEYANNEKDPLRGYENTPSKGKGFLGRLGKVKFFRSEFVTEEYLLSVQNLLKGGDSPELPFKRDARLSGYRAKALNLGGFYLRYVTDYRRRIYPTAGSLEGLRPHGKAQESLALELERRELSPEGRELLENLKEEGFSNDFFGEFRKKQLEAALSSGKTGMLVEADVTNSGLLIAGLLFKSPEILAATNGYGEDVPVDSHALFGKAYGISREEAKKVHTPLLHGSSYGSIAKVLSSLGKDVSVFEVYDKNEKTYGSSIHNISLIADYGRRVISNTMTSLKWTLPDGITAWHEAVTVSCPITLKLSDRKVNIYADVPVLLDGNGIPVFSKDSPKATKNTRSKTSGLWANIVHSVDAYVLREVVRSGIELLPKHDAFLVHPNDVQAVLKVLQRVYSEILNSNLLKNILQEIELQSGVRAPEMIYGKAEDRFHKSKMFLKVE